MPPEPSTHGPFIATASTDRSIAAHQTWVRFAVSVWLLLLLGICCRSLFLARVNTTYGFYFTGGQDWLQGKDLYQTTGNTCRYSPLIHAMLAPLPLLPERLGELVWRLVNMGVFVTGVLCWGRTLLPRLGDKHWGMVLLLTLPLSVGSLNNAQANPLMMGLILLALSAAACRRWNVAAVCLMLATLFKIYPIAIVLLLMLVYPRRFSWRFAVALTVGVLLPFALRSPEYVARQYVNWWTNLLADDRSQMDLRMGYRDLWQLVRLTGVPMSRNFYVMVQLLAGAAVAALCWLRQYRGARAADLLNTVLALGACWMMLCGPATESSTYILLAPTLAWTLVDAWRQPRSAPVKLLAAGSLALFAIAMTANWSPFTTRIHALGLHPLGALLLTAANVWVSLSSPAGQPVSADGNADIGQARAA